MKLAGSDRSLIPRINGGKSDTKAVLALDAETRSKYFALEHVFWIKLADFTDIVPRYSHLAGLGLRTAPMDLESFGFGIVSGNGYGNGNGNGNGLGVGNGIDDGKWVNGGGGRAERPGSSERERERPMTTTNGNLTNGYH